MSVNDSIREDLLELEVCRLELTSAKALARAMAYLVICNAETEAELGAVSGYAFDSILDIYHSFPDDAELREDCLKARKAMRQSEWGDAFVIETFDLELDPEWQE